MLKTRPLELYRGLLISLAALFAACDAAPLQSDAPAGAETSERALTQPAFTCTASGPTGPGRQHLALVIGVGEYKSRRITPLRGTVNDAQNFAGLLSRDGGPFEVPTDNICMLTDADATLANVLGTAKSFLLDRIDNEDHVTIFYAGHGSQVPDKSDEAGESDKRDETLVLYDSDTRADPDTPDVFVPHLTDDVFGALLDALNAKLTDGRPGAHALTVILDSCNSLSATRGGEFTARFFDNSARFNNRIERPYMDIEDHLRAAGLEEMIDILEPERSPDQVSDVGPAGAVILAAAGDGRFAFEKEGQGIFTRALLQEMALATNPLTYAQLEWRVRAAMKDAAQTPGFHGELSALLFDTETRGSGAAHSVASVSGDMVSLSGTPLFGVGPDAEFRIYDGALEGDVSDPALAKAVVRVTGGSAVLPETTVIGIAGEAEIKEGDLAVLFTPSPQAVKLSVALGDGLAPDFATALTNAVEGNERYERSIALVTSSDAYEFIARADSDEIVISDVDGAERKRIAKTQFAAGNIAKVLSGFARQKALRGLRGEGGGILEDNVSLNVSLQAFSEKEYPTSCDPAYQVAGAPREARANLFEAPICSQYQFVVTADPRTLTQELQIGVLYLSSDGEIYSIPNITRAESANQNLRLSPPNRQTGEPGNYKQVLRDVYQALPPPEAEDEILVFGVSASTPVPWWSLATTVRSATRSALNVKSRLHREINSYVDTGTRAATPVASDEPLSVWTMTRIGVRVTGDEASLAKFTNGEAAPRGGTPDWSAVLCSEPPCKTP